MLSPRTITAFAVWITAGAFGIPLFLFVTPALEARFAPVLIDQKVDVDQTDRSPGQVCWTWSWVKARYAQPIVSSWSIVVEGTAVEYPAITQRQRDREVIRDIRPASIGPGSNDLCVKIPAELDSVKQLTIKGQINYRMPHGLWTVWQELPEVKVPPLP